MKRYGQHGRKASWNVKWYGKYVKCRRKLSNDMKIEKKGKSNSEKVWKIQEKIVKRYEKYGRNVGWIVKTYGKYEKR